MGNGYTSTKAGIWNITASLGNLVGLATLNVDHATAVNIAISPQNSVAAAGQSQTFNATAYDLYSNGWNVTNSTIFAIPSAAEGSWIGTTYMCAKAGVWIINGAFEGLETNATLTVNHGSPVNFSISPKNATLNAGLSQLYSSLALDSYGNIWDAANSTVFTVDSGAGGSWAGGNYTSGKMGNWTVTAAYASFVNVSNLTVYSTIDFNRDGRVNFRDIQYFVSAYLSFSQKGILDRACDLNHEGQLNFNDIRLFVTDYIAYYIT
jgi:hypothetical protein